MQSKNPPHIKIHVWTSSDLISLDCTLSTPYKNEQKILKASEYNVFSRVYKNKLSIAGISGILVFKHFEIVPKI